MKINYLVDVELPISKPLILIKEKKIDIESEMHRFMSMHNNPLASTREKKEFMCIHWILKFAAGHDFNLRNMQLTSEGKALKLTFACDTINDVNFFTSAVNKEIGYINN